MLWLAIFVLAAASGRTPSLELRAGCMGFPSFLQWSQGKTFPYRAPLERKRAIITGYSRIRVGMPDHEVEAALGRPDWAGPSPSGCVWEYDFETPGTTGYEHGTFRILLIELGADHKLAFAYPKNIRGLHPIGTWRRGKTK